MALFVAQLALTEIARGASGDPFASGTDLVALAASSPYADAVLADQPADYYRLDETSGTIATDSSGNGRNASYSSGVALGQPGAIASEPSETSALAAGTSTIMTGSDAGLPARAAPRTVEFWFKTSACCINYATSIVAYGSDFDVAVENGAVVVYGGGNHVAIPIAYPFLDDSFHLFDVTYDGASVSAYLDGQLLGSSPLTMETNLPSAPLSAGCCSNALLDDVAIYPTALSAERIETHWTVGASPTATLCAATPTSPYAKSVLASAPAAYFKLGDFSTSSPVAYDSSGHCGNGAYFHGDASVPGPLKSEQAAGTEVNRNGSSTNFTASDAGLPAGSSSRTVEFWFHVPSCCIRYPTSVVSYGSDFGVSLQNSYVYVYGGGHEISIPLPYGVWNGTWHMFDVTYNGSSASVFVDGQFQGSASLPMNTDLPTAGLIGHGEETASLADVAIYSAALSAASIDAHWSAGASPSGTACEVAPKSSYPKSVLSNHPAVFYKLDDFSTTSFVAYDFSGHCANGAYPNTDRSVPGAISSELSSAAEDYNNATNTIFRASEGGLPSGNASRTAEFWFKWSGCCINYATTVLSYGSDFDVALENGHVVVYGDGGHATVALSSQFLDNAFHFFAVAYSGGSVAVYLDGHLQGKAPLTFSTGLSATGLVGSCCEFGELDDVAIYPSALSAKQILAHFNAAIGTQYVSPDTAVLDGVACPTGGHTCFSVGTSVTNEGAVVPITSAGLPKKAVDLPGVTHLYGVACTPSGAQCYAVGASSAGDGVIVPLDSAGKAGTPTNVPQTSRLEGIACQSGGGCLAVGSRTGQSGAEGVGVPIGSGGSVGGTQPVPETSELSAVTCPNTCVAVGEVRGGETGVVDMNPGVSAANVQGVEGAKALTGVACQTAVSCQAVGTTAGGTGVIVPITNGVANRAQPFTASGDLAGIFCPAKELGCLGVGLGPGDNVAAISELSGSVETVQLAGDLYATTCESPSKCVAVGITPDLSHGFVEPVATTNDLNLNNGSQSCGPVVRTGGQRFDGVKDEFLSQPNAYNGIRATIGPAAVCHGGPYPISSWVMLEDQAEEFVQGGVSYDSSGTDYPFVEARVAQMGVRSSFADRWLKYEEGGSIEIYALHQISTGRFAVIQKGVQPSGYDAQCPWVIKAGQVGAYKELQGDMKPEQRREVEVTVNGECLWIYYTPVGLIMSEANLVGGELQYDHDQVPGTDKHPLSITGSEVEYSGEWQNYVSDESGTPQNPAQPLAPTPEYVLKPATVNVGCKSYVPYWGSGYTLDTWSPNETGSCGPWAAAAP